MANFRATPNAEQIPVNLVGGSTFGRFNKISPAYTQNMYMSEEWLIPFPGYKKSISPTTNNEGRGLFRSVRGNVMIQIVGSSVYRIDANNDVILMGTLATQAGEVFMAENLNNQIAIVDGLNLYITNHTLPPNLTVQSGGDLGTGLIPNYVSFHQTYFLIGNANDTSNGAAWYAFSYASATTVTQTVKLSLSTKPDYALAVLPIPSQCSNVLVMGTTVCEIHQAIGGTQYYRRVNGLNVDYGCLSIGTIASSDEFIIWLGVNEYNAPVIIKYAGQSIEAISTDGIDYLMSTIQFPSQSTAYIFRTDGHLFYVLNFYNAADNVSIMYDFDTKKFFHLSDQAENFFPARQMAYFNLKTYFIHLTNGGIYEISSSLTKYDENTVPTTDTTYNTALVYEIPRTRITEPIRRADSARFVANSFVFTLAQGDDPNVTGISVNSALQSNIVTETSFNPPYDPTVTQTGLSIVAEINTSPITNNDISPWLAPTSIVYRPRIDMSISKDSGTTFSNSVTRYLNPQGKRENILTYNNLGRANDLTIKLKFWGTSNFIVANGILDIY